MPHLRLHVDAGLVEGEEIVLPADASRHAARTLRLEAGDSIIVFDGRSDFEYEATIIASGGRSGRGGDSGLKALLGAPRAVASESPLRIELAQGLCKGERMDFAVQKATELGVCAIHPLLCERSVSRPEGERAKRRIERWREVAIHAAGQSGRVRIPAIASIQTYGDWVRRSAGDSKIESPGRDSSAFPPGFFLHPEASESFSDLASVDFERRRFDPEQPLRLIVGPEGGFSPREIEAAQEAGYRGLRLGPRVLRTETAGPVAIALLQSRWGDLG